MHAIIMASRFETFSKKAGVGLLLACLNFLTLSAAAQTNNAAAYTWTTLAGYNGTGSADGAGGNAQFNFPTSVAVDSTGNLYVVDSDNNTIRKITPAGVASTIAGLARSAGYADGTNSTARFSFRVLSSIAMDNAGNLFVTDTGNCIIRKLTPLSGTTNWVVSTWAGQPGNQIYADGTVPYGADFFSPGGIAVDSHSNVFVTDYDGIRKVARVGTNLVVSTIAGSEANYGSADGTNSAAQFYNPSSIAVDGAGNVYVADSDNQTIREIMPEGTNWVVSTIAGSAGQSGSADGVGSAARFGGSYGGPHGIAADTNGNVYVADSYNNTIRKITPVVAPLLTNWVVSTLAGNASITNYYGVVGGSANGTGTNALFNFPCGVTVDNAGNIYAADYNNCTVRKITSAGVVSTIAGSAGSTGSADGTGSAARFNFPQSVALDNSGSVYVADYGNDTIRKVTAAGVVSTIAGLAGSPGNTDGVGNYALFDNPASVAVDGSGNVFVADYFNQTIRQITPAGVVSTIAGSAGSPGNTDGTGTNATFFYPAGIAVDSADNLYVADSANDTIRKIAPAGTNWVTSTIAGVPGNFPGAPGNYGSADGTGTNATFFYPSGITVDSADNLYVADSGNDTIRQIIPVGNNWVVTTIAGLAGNNGSADGTGTNAQFYDPQDIAVDSAGNLYASDTGNEIIRKITPAGTNWVVSTIGGLVRSVGSADGAGSAAQFYAPHGVAVDNAGNVYVADFHNNTIRKGVFTAYGFANAVSYSSPAMNSSLTVTFFPTNANGQWRFPWEVAWRNSGQTASNLVAGNYPVVFQTIPGWLAIPSSLTVAVTNSVSLTNQYYPTISTVGTNNGGTLTVTLGPNPPSGAGWGFLGAGPPSFSSGYSTNLAAGTYLIAFAPVSGRATPPNLSVQVQAGQTTSLDENYLLAQSAPGGVLLPTPVPVSNISNLSVYPFGFNGQLETDVGYGSGVAVEPNVVLTAAHLVFNDQTLNYVSQAYWYFQEETGVFQPEPLAARGWYVLSGYAAQRTNDLEVYSPDTSTPQSRNLDVAALYFLSPVAGGGYGGYLPSDESPNTWLTGTSLKMLVGYPVDGSLFGDASIVPGEMYQTQPQPYPLAMATDPVADQQVYTAPWFLSYPGNSGGPMYVQLNGYYYPAGVYLGTLYNGVTPYASAVRAIDSAVVNLITNAAVLGDNGTNNSGGGVITIIPNQALSISTPGYMEWLLSPPSAVAAGAGWRLLGDANYGSASNYIRAVTSTNAVVQFNPIAGWNLPTNQTVNVLPNQINTYSAFYTVSNPVMVVNGTVGLGIRGTTGTVYEIDRRSSLSSGSWMPVSTNTILTNGFNLLLPKPSTNGPVNFYRALWLP